MFPSWNSDKKESGQENQDCNHGSGVNVSWYQEQVDTVYNTRVVTKYKVYQRRCPEHNQGSTSEESATTSTPPEGNFSTTDLGQDTTSTVSDVNSKIKDDRQDAFVKVVKTLISMREIHNKQAEFTDPEVKNAVEYAVNQMQHNGFNEDNIKCSPNNKMNLESLEVAVFQMIEKATLQLKEDINDTIEKKFETIRQTLSNKHRTPKINSTDKIDLALSERADKSKKEKIKSKKAEMYKIKNRPLLIPGDPFNDSMYKFKNLLPSNIHDVIFNNSGLNLKRKNFTCPENVVHNLSKKTSQNKYRNINEDHFPNISESDAGSLIDVTPKSCFVMSMTHTQKDEENGGQKRGSKNNSSHHLENGNPGDLNDISKFVYIIFESLRRLSEEQNENKAPNSGQLTNSINNEYRALSNNFRIEKENSIPIKNYLAEHVTQLVSTDNCVPFPSPEHVTQFVTPEHDSQFVTPEHDTQFVTPEHDTQLVTPENDTQLVAADQITQFVSPENFEQLVTPEHVTQFVTPEHGTQFNVPEQIQQYVSTQVICNQTVSITNINNDMGSQNIDHDNDQQDLTSLALKIKQEIDKMEKESNIKIDVNSDAKENNEDIPHEKGTPVLYKVKLKSAETDQPKFKTLGEEEYLNRSMQENLRQSKHKNQEYFPRGNYKCIIKKKFHPDKYLVKKMSSLSKTHFTDKAQSLDNIQDIVGKMVEGSLRSIKLNSQGMRNSSTNVIRKTKSARENSRSNAGASRGDMRSNESQSTDISLDSHIKAFIIKNKNVAKNFQFDDISSFHDTSSDSQSEDTPYTRNYFKRLCLLNRRSKNEGNVVNEHLVNIYNALCTDEVSEPVFKSVLFISEQLRNGTQLTKDKIVDYWIKICNKPIEKEKKPNMDWIQVIWSVFKQKICLLSKSDSMQQSFFPALLSGSSEHDQLLKEIVIQKYAKEIIDYIADPKMIKIHQTR